eukprot:5062087-Pleurochrysis_carterae.AAC.3
MPATTVRDAKVRWQPGLRLKRAWESGAAGCVACISIIATSQCNLKQLERCKWRTVTMPRRGNQYFRTSNLRHELTIVQDRPIVLFHFGTAIGIGMAVVCTQLQRVPLPKQQPHYPLPACPSRMYSKSMSNHASRSETR